MSGNVIEGSEGRTSSSSVLREFLKVVGFHLRPEILWLGVNGFSPFCQQVGGRSLRADNIISLPLRGGVDYVSENDSRATEHIQLNSYGTNRAS